MKEEQNIKEEPTITTLQRVVGGISAIVVCMVFLAMVIITLINMDLSKYMY